jgi:PEP-CTERM motif
MEKKTLGQKLVLYGIGAGAASMAVPADADIIWSGPVEFSGNTIFYDLENVVPPSAIPDSANHDFELNLRKKKASNYDVSSNGTTVGSTDSATRGMYSFSYAIRHNSGDTIGSGGNFASYAFLQNAYPGGYFDPGEGLGDWNPGDRGFLGLSLVVGGNTYFGWADVTLNNLDGTGIGAFTLHSYAYENVADTSILAGAVPEPGTIALLVAGAAGVLALKRRQK